MGEIVVVVVIVALYTNGLFSPLQLALEPVGCMGSIFLLKCLWSWLRVSKRSL
jgi:hypothetical protein